MLCFWTVKDANGDEGHVVACSSECAHKAAEAIDMALGDEAEEALAEEGYVCDGCGGCGE